MFRRFFAEKGIILLLVISITVVAITFTFYRMKKAEKDLADYWVAKSCSIQENCRRKIELTIIEGNTTKIDFVGGRFLSLHDVSYTIVLSSLDIKNQTIEIQANPPSNGTPFDVGNVHIPTGLDSHFIEKNFVKNQTVYVETWQDKITFIYLDTIVDIPNNEIQLVPTPGISETQTTITASPQKPNTYEIALPTKIHPIFRQASTERDFTSAIILSSLLLLVTFPSVIGKDVDKFWKKIFNRKENKQSSIE